MDDRSVTMEIERDPERCTITAEGIAAIIPASLIAALLNRQAPTATEPVTVDARSLRISLSLEAIATMLSALQPDRPVDIAFEDGAIVASTAGLPPIRLAFPVEGLRLSVTGAGVRLGG